VRSGRATWICALVFIAAFAAGLMAVILAMGWFSEEVRASVPFGVAPVELSSKHVAIALAFFAASHVVPRLVPRRRLASRVAVELREDGSYRSAPSVTRVTLNAAELRAATAARRDVGLAWSLAFCLAIAGIGFFVPSHGFHGPRQHPLEWWVYFAASVLAIASHGART